MGLEQQLLLHANGICIVSNTAAQLLIATHSQPAVESVAAAEQGDPQGACVGFRMAGCCQDSNHLASGVNVQAMQSDRRTVSGCQHFGRHDRHPLNHCTFV